MPRELKKSIEDAFQGLGVTSLENRLVGINLDGVSVNMGRKRGVARLFFFNWDSLHARLKCHYEYGVTRKEAQKRLQDTANLFRKNLQLKDVC